MSKNNILDFSYPIKHDMRWHFEWPWNVLGGLHGWVYKKWDIQKDNVIWHGKIIMGWKKIIVEYTCSPEIALREHISGQARLFKYLTNLVVEEDRGCCKSHSPDNEKCCQDKSEPMPFKQVMELISKPAVITKEQANEQKTKTKSTKKRRS